MTFKKAMLRGALGFPLGVFISYTVGLVESLCYGGWNTGDFLSVPPSMIPQAGNEMRAVVLEFILSGLIGFAFAAGSAIFQIDRWSLAKQTVCHFVLMSLVFFPAAWLCCWFGKSVGSILSFALIYCGIYFFSWIFQYHYWKKKILSINQKLNGN